MMQYIVSHGGSSSIFFTACHARQYEDALRMKGTPFTTVKWLKLADSMTRVKAEKFAAKVKREDAKLRKLGGDGNNSQVEVRFDREDGAFGHKRERFAVWVVRNYELN